MHFDLWPLTCVGVTAAGHVEKCAQTDYDRPRGRVSPCTALAVLNDAGPNR